MAATTFPTRYGSQFADLGGTGASDITTDKEWRTVRRFRSRPPDTLGDWWIGCSYSMIVPPTAQAWIRLRVTNSTGGQWITDQAFVSSSTLSGITWWVKVLSGAQTTNDHHIEVQIRREGAGLVRLARVEPQWISTPPLDWQQPSDMASVVGGQHWRANGLVTLNTPAAALGTGKTMIGICVAPGPGYDTGGEAWVDPHPDATLIQDYEVDAGSPYQFVQRFRAWFWTEDGTASYTFGYNKAAGENHQQAAIYGLDKLVPFVGCVGPEVNTNNNTGYPSVNVVDDYQVIAVSTTQQSHELLNQPTGYAGLSNGTTLGGPTDWRRMAVGIKAASNTTETPTGGLWSAGAGEAHAHFTMTIPPGS